MTETSKKHIQLLQQEYQEYKRSPKFSLNSEELFCICRKPDNGDLMVACDGCDDWFHFNCMKINEDYKELIKGYYCAFCDELLGKGKTLWKKKCRLQECFKPINGESKFCCEEHGIIFWKDILNKFDEDNTNDNEIDIGEIVRRNEIESFVRLVKDRDELMNIGQELLKFDKGEIVIGKEKLDEVEVINSEIKIFENELDILKLKEKFLWKLKEKIGNLNDLLTNSLKEPSDNEIEDGDDDSIKKKKTKKNRKFKKLKIDICGYDARLQLSNDEWKVFFESPDYQLVTNFNGILNDEKDMIVKEYHLLKDKAEEVKGESEKVMIDQKETFFKDICIADKKKCHRHLNWFNIIKDDVELKLDEYKSGIDEKNENKEKLRKFVNAKNWEYWEHSN